MSLVKKGNWVSSLLMILFVSAAFLPKGMLAQADDEKVYKLNPWIDGGIIAGTVVMTKLGLDAQNAQPTLSEEEVLSLDPQNVNAFDRGAIYQDPEKLEDAVHNSDLALNITTGLVLVLALDKKARHHWLEGIVMYVEAMSVNAGIQGWVAYGTNRYRP